MSYDEIYREHARHVWGLCYRMTGSASDADDLVQETFARAIERPPARTDEPWRPWLVRVAVNLAKDHLRRRKRQAYVGPWLPSPIATGDDVAGSETAAGRYDSLESISFAFLLALEALSPQQRAVLLLRDVFDYSVRETAVALALSEPNVKTSHHRARRAMAGYDRARSIPTADVQEKTRRAIERFAFALFTADMTQMEALLCESVHALTDGGGEFFAALRPVVGRDRVARFFLGLQRKIGSDGATAFRMMNGSPAVFYELASGSARGAHARYAPRIVLRCDLDADGRIAAIHTVLATAKLTAVGNPRAASASLG